VKTITNCSGVFHSKLMVFGHIIGRGKLGCWNLGEGEKGQKKVKNP